MKVNPTIAQKLGPLGLNMGKIIADINTATASFKGMRVPVNLDVNAKTKTYKVEVSTPPTAELLKKELGIEKGTGASLKQKVGNAAIEQIVKVAKTKQEGMLVNNLKSAVKTVIGSCVSLGILVESKEPKEVEKEIDNGEYQDIIKKQIDKASPEKLKKLEEEFNVIKEEQEKIAKAEAEAAAAAAAAAATATGTTAATTAETTAGAAPAAGTAEAATGTATATAPAKTPVKEEKKK